jgi:hypothetical protein
MPVSFSGSKRDDGTATADSLFGRRGNNPYSHYRFPERGTYERTLMLGRVIASRYPRWLGVIRDRVDPAASPAMSAMPRIATKFRNAAK